MILNINFLHKFLLIGLILTVSYVAYTLTLPGDYSPTLTASQAAGRPVNMNKTDIKTTKDYGSFINDIQTREVFAAGFQEQTAVQTKEADKTLSSLKRNLKLVGVIKDTPKTAVIEHTGLQRSFYLKQGQSFLEGIVVEKIAEDFVVLKFQGEHIEFYL